MPMASWHLQDLEAGEAHKIWLLAVHGGWYLLVS